MLRLVEVSVDPGWIPLALQRPAYPAADGRAEPEPSAAPTRATPFLEGCLVFISLYRTIGPSGHLDSVQRQLAASVRPVSICHAFG